MSDGCIGEQSVSIEDYLLKNIPLAVSVERANKADDKNGIDWWVTLISGRKLGIDVKVREVDWSKKGSDDLALETWSVMEKQIIGWTRNPDKQTDYIVWLWKDTGRLVIIQFPWLCSFFMTHWEAWRKKYKTRVQRTVNNSSQYHSECVFVPRELIFTLLYRAIGGLAA